MMIFSSRFMNRKAILYFMKELPLHIIIRNEIGSDISYRIRYQEQDRDEGHVNVSVQRCGSQDNNDPFLANMHLCNWLKECGVTEDDHGIKIRDFLPNGGDVINKPYEHMKQGMGSKMFSTLLNDASEIDARFIYFLTVEEEMIRFCIKQGFSNAGKHHYFRMV
jgi:hypothetical protein